MTSQYLLVKFALYFRYIRYITLRDSGWISRLPQ